MVTGPAASYIGMDVDIVNAFTLPPSFSVSVSVSMSICIAYRIQCPNRGELRYERACLKGKAKRCWKLLTCQQQQQQRRILIDIRHRHHM